MSNKIEVKCKYFKDTTDPEWCTINRLFNNSTGSCSINGSKEPMPCLEMFGRINCCDPFKIDWVKFLVHRQHVKTKEEWGE